MGEHRCDFFIEVCVIRMNDKLVSSAKRTGLELFPAILIRLFI